MRWEWLATLPTTNMKLFSASALNWATALVSFYMFVNRIEPTAAYDAWLWILAGLNGFAVSQFGWKRQTDMDYQATKNATTPDVNVTTKENTVVLPATPPASATDAAPIAEPIAEPAPARRGAIKATPKPSRVRDD